MLPRKCYSTAHGSLCKELVNRKSHSSSCVKINKVTLYDLLYRALEGGPLDSALQPHEKIKDGMKVIKAIYTQHGGTQKWEKAHESQTVCLTIPWSSSKYVMSLTDQILKCSSVVMDISRYCKHTGRTSPTERELVILLIESITFNDQPLTAHIVMVTSDPTGLGMRFEDTATFLMLADPTGSV